MIASSSQNRRKFIVLVLLWTLLVVPAGSFLYALAVYNLQWVAVSVLIVFSFAFLNGFGITAFATKYDCRTQTAPRVAAVLIGMLSLYLSWVSWVWMLNDYWSLGLIFNPLRLARVIGFLATDDFRLWGGHPVPPWEWGLAWIGEALALVLIPAMVVGNRTIGQTRTRVTSPGEVPDNGREESPESHK